MPVTPATLDLLRTHGINVPALQVGTHLHPDISFEPPCLLTKNVRWDTAVSVGAFSMLHGGGECVATTIGRYCSVAPDAVLGANEHAIEWLSTSSLLENPHQYGWSALDRLVGAHAKETSGFVYQDSIRPITIGNDVWIGRGAFVKGGVSIGDGAVIAAKTVVVKDVPPFTIVAGNPARAIRLRFAETVIARIQEHQWWQYSIYDLLKLGLTDASTAIDEIARQAARGTILRYSPARITAEQMQK